MTKPHSGPYLAAEGETWVTMAHYEELLAERDSLEEQLESAQRALKQIVGMYEFEQVAADGWEDSGGHVGIARHDRAVLQGIGMARDIAVEALSNPAKQPYVYSGDVNDPGPFPASRLRDDLSSQPTEET